jgi:XTP/dITP diphosphohydrolase
MKQLVLGTHNVDKTGEFRLLLPPIGVEILTLDSFPGEGRVVENADTLEGNALLKARAAHRASGLPALADDTGLEVYYLNGAPGDYSSRYAGMHATYTENVAKLLKELRGVPARRRGARFRCVLAFVTPDSEPVLVEGVCHGTILEQPRGKGGFGYDPVFLPSGHNATFAEMDIALKNSLSHRGKAIAAIIPTLMTYMKKAGESS